jgi:hypothetical protein
MGTLAEKLIAALNSRIAVRDALIDKGSDVDAPPFSEYAARIAELQGGKAKVLLRGSVAQRETCLNERLSLNSMRMR